MIETFREKLKKEGHTLKWFYDRYLKDTTLSYGGFNQQLCGYTVSGVSEIGKKAIKKYLAD